MQSLIVRGPAGAAWPSSRWAALAASLVALVACGGATPEPKDADDAVPHAEAKPAETTRSAPSVTEAQGTSNVTPAAEGDPLAAVAATAKASGDSASGAAAGGDDPWMASHQMSPKDVLAGVRPAQSKAQACFHQGQKKDPSISGEVKIRFVITNAGAVRAWRDEASTMDDPDVTTCIGEVIKTLKFPKQKSPGDAWGVYSAKFSN